ncbi:MAG: hypothetical protein QOI38_95 [Sphingomonadales bacterium]|jgi:hypothetical protein|nr:hypothetical protein [Sphingomonadales bacterium]
MGFTKAEELFLGVRDPALNDFLAAFYFERHRYFDFGSTLGPTTASHTFFPPLNVFNTSIPWRIEISLPTLDIHPGGSPLPPPLVLGPGKFSGSTSVKITAANFPFTFQLLLIGHLSQVGSGSTAALKLTIDQVKIVGLPPALAAMLEAVFILIVNGLLANFTMPMAIFAFQPFHLVAGPILGSDQVELRGNL